MIEMITNILRIYVLIWPFVFINAATCTSIDNTQTNDSPSEEMYITNLRVGLDISLESLAQESRAALSTLYFMSFLYNNNIPASYIDAFLNKIKAREKPTQVLKRLSDLALVEIIIPYTGNGKEAPHYFSLHELVQRLIRERISVEEKKKFLAIAKNYAGCF